MKLKKKCMEPLEGSAGHSHLRLTKGGFFDEIMKMDKRSTEAPDDVELHADTFQSQRLIVADRVFEAYDFGDREVECTGGWSWEIPGRGLWKAVFVRRVDGPTEALDFIVGFKDASSLEVTEIICGPNMLARAKTHSEPQDRAVDGNDRRRYKNRQFVARMKIGNPRELFEAAYKKCREQGESHEAVLKGLLNRNGNVDIDACLIAMLDPRVLAGCEIYYSDSEPTDE